MKVRKEDKLNSKQAKGNYKGKSRNHWNKKLKNNRENKKTKNLKTDKLDW